MYQLFASPASFAATKKGLVETLTLLPFNLPQPSCFMPVTLRSPTMLDISIDGMCHEATSPQ